MITWAIGIVNLLLLFFFVWWYWKREISSIRNFYWPALLLKVACGLLLGLLYTYYYSANDTFYFFDAAIVLSNKAHTNIFEYLMTLIEPDPGYFSGEARSLFFIKVVSVVALLTYGNYWIASIYFSLLTFYSAWYLTKVIVTNQPAIKLAAVVSFLFFPSAVFWSSGIIKESLAMASLFFLSAIVFNIWCNQRVRPLLYLLGILAIAVTWNLKYYYIGLFLPIVTGALIVKWISNTFKFQSFFREIILFGFFLLVGIGAISFIHPNFNMLVIAEVVVANNKAFVELSSPDDVIHFVNLQANAASLILNAPWAFISGIYRPFVLEATSVIKVVASIENLFLLALTVVPIVRWRKLENSNFRILFLAALLYCIVLCIFLAMSSPNFGTLARYKVGFLSFFVLLLSSNPLIERFYERIIYFGR